MVRPHLGEPGSERITHDTILAYRLINGHAKAAAGGNEPPSRGDDSGHDDR